MIKIDNYNESKTEMLFILVKPHNEEFHTFRDIRKNQGCERNLNVFLSKKKRYFLFLIMLLKFFCYSFAFALFVIPFIRCK